MKAESQHKDDLEKMLQSEAGQFALEPSENVWQKVRIMLHPRNRGKVLPWLWLPLLLVATGIGGYFVFYSHAPASNVISAPAQSSAAAQYPGGTPVPSKSTIKDRAQPDTYPLTSLTVSREKLHPVVSEKKRKSDVASVQETSPRTSPVMEQKEQRLLLDGDSLAENRRSSSPAANTGEVIQKDQHLSVPETSHPATGTGLPIKTGSSLKIAANSPSPAPLSQTDSLAGPGSDQHVADDQQAATAKQIITTSSKKTSLMWEAYFAPALTYRFLHLPAGSGINLRSLHDQPSDGFSAGIRISRHLKAGWGLATGLEMNRLEYKMNAQSTYPAYLNASGAPSIDLSQRNSFFVVANTGYANAFAASSLAGSLYNSYFYIGIPLLVSYSWPLPGKWSLGFSAGAGLDYLAVKRINILSPDGRYFTDDSRVQRWNSLFRFSPEVSIPLGKRFGFDFGPDLHYQLFSTFGKYNVREHPYAIGLKLGVQVK